MIATKLIIIFFIFIFQFAFAVTEEAPPIRVYIKSNARLYNLNYSSNYETNKGIYALVIEKDHIARNEFWVLDKKGEKRYIVEARDVVEINDDMNLLPGEIGNKTYPPLSLLKSVNHQIQFESELSLHFDELDLKPIQQLKANSVDTILAPRYQLTTNYISTIPINAGIELSIQEAAWKDQNQITTQLTIVTFGPNFKYRIIDSDNYSLAATGSYEYALTYQTANAATTNSYSAYIWSLGAINEFQSKIGTLEFGIDYRKHFIQLSNLGNNLPSNEYSMSSLGAYIGYKINWDL